MKKFALILYDLFSFMVNTFLPHPHIKKSLKSLDYKRLGKQRVEAMQILKMILYVSEQSRILGLPFASFLDAKSPEKARFIFDRMQAYRETCSLLRKEGHKVGFSTHPAAVMWVGYEEYLKKYINTSIKLWIKKGYKNTMATYSVSPDPVKPWWWGHSLFHDSHKASLQFKHPDHYSQYFSEYTFTDYVWPCSYDVLSIRQVIRSRPNEFCPYEYTGPHLLDSKGKVKVVFE